MRRTSPFSGPFVYTYAEQMSRQVPGLLALHRMTTMLLAEQMPADGRGWSWAREAACCAVGAQVWTVGGTAAVFTGCGGMRRAKPNITARGLP
jgi:hypothetical protein